MHETTRPGPDSTTELRIIGQLEYLSPRSGLYDNGALPFRASSPEAGPIAQLAASRVDGDQVADVLDQIASYAAFLTSGDTHPVAALYLATVLVEQGDVSSVHVSDAARMAGDIHDMVALVMLSSATPDILGSAQVWGQPGMISLVDRLLYLAAGGGGGGTLFETPKRRATAALEIATRTWSQGSYAGWIVEGMNRLIEAVLDGQLDPGLSPKWFSAVADDLTSTFESDIAESRGN